jgi:hypothetical protein
MHEYDVIIIGGGISGLYSALKILEHKPDTSILILEKNIKSKFGGRLGNYNFYGTNIVKGAGIGRKNKDILLQKLLKKLNIKTHEFKVKKQYSQIMNKNDVVSISDTVKKLRDIYNKNKKKSLHSYNLMTFKKFGIKVLGYDNYKRFLISTGYRDFKKTDVYETLYKYGFDDTDKGWIGLSIPWSELIKKLSYKIGFNKIKFNQDIISIHSVHTLNEKKSKYANDTNNTNNTNNTKYIIKSKSGKKYISKKIIVASTIDTVKNLFKKNPIYNDIKGQVFLRMYGKFSGESIDIMKKYAPVSTTVKTRIQKIIPINAEKGVYMISYCDNKNAIYYKSYLTNNKKNRLFWENQLQKALGLKSPLKLQSIKGFYWNIGTHYYKPLNPKYKTRNNFIDMAQHPDKNILVVGEMISRKQGWTEGALESVEKVVTPEWIDN